MSAAPTPIWLLLFLALIAILIVLLLWRRFAVPRASSPATPVCGRCGYSARGLPTFTCPECGSDLREVGILIPGVHRTPVFGSLGPSIAWSLFLGIVALVITSLVFHYALPTIYTAQQRYTLITPGSGQYKSVQFHSHGTHIDWPYQQPQRSRILDWVDVTLVGNDDKTIRLRASIDKLGYEYTDAHGKTIIEANGLNRAVVLNWMKSAGLQSDDSRLAAEADEIVQVIRDATHLSMGGSRSTTFAGRQGGQSSSYAAKPRIVAPVALFFWLGIWLYGLWRISRPKVQPRALTPATPA